ncbi:hypothetical protein PHYPSEUDO_004131 [Phytophthora pseudosyringae]|uniref:Uncharacterized protein n=1 Tax=Phytophthora pseudosyringae TaxID=221518 RepID=A0A8T1WIV4_9STRA|nr:hypothetical protein PHYPSEUDO_004131 [Phytophthora pseudosyringae]
MWELSLNVGSIASPKKRHEFAAELCQDGDDNNLLRVDHRTLEPYYCNIQSALVGLQALINKIYEMMCIQVVQMQWPPKDNNPVPTATNSDGVAGHASSSDAPCVTGRLQKRKADAAARSAQRKKMLGRAKNTAASDGSATPPLQPTIRKATGKQRAGSAAARSTKLHQPLRRHRRWTHHRNRCNVASLSHCMST